MDGLFNEVRKHYSVFFLAVNGFSDSDPQMAEKKNNNANILRIGLNFTKKPRKDLIDLLSSSFLFYGLQSFSICVTLSPTI